jgi:hypothetical protein
LASWSLDSASVSSILGLLELGVEDPVLGRCASEVAFPPDKLLLPDLVESDDEDEVLEEDEYGAVLAASLGCWV